MTAIALAGLLLLAALVSRVEGAGFSGKRALEHVRAQVALGPRPPGSPASARTRDYLRRYLEGLGYRVEAQAFTASTPLGPVEMANLVAVWPGERPGVLLLGAHYDTKRFSEIEFVGANDGASGVACLLELGRAFSREPLQHTLVLAFFDGEEALVRWSARDGLYGSRHFVATWPRLREVKGAIILDMVGDRKLRVTREMLSHPGLRDLVWREAARLGHSSVFSGPAVAIEDDHLPFLRAGIPALDLIGFDGGGYPDYWHTARDNLDQVSAESLQVVGRVAQAALRRLDSAEH